MTAKFMQPVGARLEGVAELVRRNADQRIGELQSHVQTLSTASGRFLNRQVLSGAGTYTPTPGTRTVHLKWIGGGGGGGGATPGAGAGAGAGGSSGVLFDLWITTQGGGDLRGGTYSGGAGGAGGSSAGGNGGAGGSSTIVINGVTNTAPGGAGGAGVVGVATDGNVMPTAPTYTLPSGGLATYGLGEPGIMLAGPSAWFSGDGGSSPMGAGGVAVGGTTAGNPGQLYGGGGSGAAAQTTGKAGGAGAAGGFEIEEYT